MGANTRNRFIRAGHVVTPRIRRCVVEVAIDLAVHNSQAHGEVIREAAADITLKVLTIVTLKTRSHSAGQAFAHLGCSRAYVDCAR